MSFLKKLFPVALILAACLLFLPTDASAAGGVCGQQLRWSLDDSGILTISGTGDMYDYGAASQTPWYAQRESVYTLVIEYGVTKIGDNAFAYCTKLTSAAIADSVKTVGTCAFDSCVYLKQVSLGSGVTTIGDGAFTFCYDLETVSIPASVTQIGRNAFSNCLDLQSIRVDGANPNYADVDGILFDKAKTTLLQAPGKLSGTYKIPDSVTVVEVSAFAYCRELTGLHIPAGVEAIGAYAFQDCTGLKNIWCVTPKEDVIIGVGNELLTALPWYAVLGSGTCGANLTWLLDETGTLIISGTGPMEDYELPWKGWSTNIRKVVMTDGVTTVGRNAFYLCQSLQEVEFPGTLKEIRGSAFECCTSLTEVTIPNGVTTIGDSAFAFCTGITALDIPDSVTEIGDTAFRYCRDMRRIKLPKNLTTISDNLLLECESLTGVVLPDAVTAIGDCAFNHCYALQKVTFSQNVKTIGEYAFACCDALTHVYYGGTQAQWRAVSIMQGNDCLKNARLHLPGESLPGDLDDDGMLTTDDAVYLLLHVMFGREDYPVPEGVDLDFNGDAAEDTDDAVYLLLHVMFGAEDYPLYA